MKKNTMMRIASVLLVAVLLSTCVISGTYAKYTSSVTATDSARVAYWGFNGTSTINLPLFTYTDAGVQNPDGIIAPGTTGTAALNLVYTNGSDGTNPITAPEVDYTLDVTVTANCDAALKNELTWQLDGDDIAFDDIATEIEKADGTYEAGTLPDLFKTGVNLTWAWAFEDGADDREKAVANAADTALGNAATLDDVSITITITATQLDEYTATP